MQHYPENINCYNFLAEKTTTLIKIFMKLWQLQEKNILNYYFTVNKMIPQE